MKAFYSKLQNWRRKVTQGNVAMFEKLSSVVKKLKNLRAWRLTRRRSQVVLKYEGRLRTKKVRETLLWN